jgi:hypothetical protein
MKYSSEQINSTEILNRLVDILAVAGITLIVLFTMEVVAHETTSNDVRQALFAILAVAILSSDLFSCWGEDFSVILLLFRQKFPDRCFLIMLQCNHFRFQ